MRARAGAPAALGGGPCQFSVTVTALLRDWSAEPFLAMISRRAATFHPACGVSDKTTGRTYSRAAALANPSEEKSGLEATAGKRKDDLARREAPNE